MFADNESIVAECVSPYPTSVQAAVEDVETGEVELTNTFESADSLVLHMMFAKLLEIPVTDIPEMIGATMSVVVGGVVVPWWSSLSS